MGDRVAECRADMQAIHQAANEIENALESVDALCGPDVWSGPAGERFREEWQGPRTGIRSALDSIREQTDTIIARVQREEREREEARR